MIWSEIAEIYLIPVSTVNSEAGNSWWKFSSYAASNDMQRKYGHQS